MQCFDYDLDLPMDKRLAPIFIAFDEKIDTLVRHVDTLLRPYSSALTVLGLMEASISKNAMYADELQYITEHTGLTFAETLFMQLIYEASSACTTGCNANFYLRTMDWEMPFLKDYTIQLNITRSGVPVCKAITWVGYVGFLTTWTDAEMIAVNYRRTCDMTIGTMLNNAQRVAAMYWPVGYLVREVAVGARSSSTLSSATLVSPCYITILDLKNSSKSKVIVRSADRCTSVRAPNEGVLVQTNCDAKGVGCDILHSFARITSFEKLLVEEEDDIDALVAKALTFPIKNSSTIYYWALYRGEVRVGTC